MMKRLTLLLWVAGLFILGLSSLHAQTGGPFLPSAADNRCRQWVDSVLSGLNVHEKVGQLIVATIPARADKATKKQMRELVKKYKVGGLLFSEGTPEEQAILTNMARKDAKIPVMVTFDGEWGLSMRLKGAPDYPRNAALGCIEDNGPPVSRIGGTRQFCTRCGCQYESAEPGDTRTLLWREPAAGGGKGGGIQPWARKRGHTFRLQAFPRAWRHGCGFS